MTDQLCEWKLEVLVFKGIYDTLWQTNCGKEFEFINDEEVDPDFKFCPFCRAEIIFNEDKLRKLREKTFRLNDDSIMDK